MKKELRLESCLIGTYENIDLTFGNLTLGIPRINAAHLPQALSRIKEQRNRVLLNYSREKIVNVIDRLAARWLDPQDPVRKKALELMPYTTRLSKEHLSFGLDLAFREITAPKLKALLDTDAEKNRINKGPELITHILAGIIPTPCLFNVVLALLSGSSSFIKCASIEPVFPYLLYQTLYEIQPDIAQCILVSWWKGSDREIEDCVFKESDIICAYGRNETLQNIRNRTPITTRFIPYGNRMSLGVLLKESCIDLHTIAKNTALDICLFDQQGCLSPHVIYIEGADMSMITEFSKCLAKAMQDISQKIPLGNIDLTTTAKIQAIRAKHEAKEASGHEIKCRSSYPNLDWTIIEDSNPAFVLSCLNRVITLKPLSCLELLPKLLSPWKNYLQAIGYAGPIKRLKGILTSLHSLGVNRLCPLGTMQSPPLAWHHDGMHPLEVFRRWIDLEK